MHRDLRSAQSPRSRPVSAPSAGRRQVGRPYPGNVAERAPLDGDDSSQLAQVFKSFKGHGDRDSSSGEQPFRTLDFSKMNENRCKYSRHESPLDSAASTKLPPALEGRDPQDVPLTRGATSPCGVNQGHLWHMKEELFEGFRSDLLELGKAVVGTLKLELQERSDNLGWEMRGAMNDLAQELKLNVASTMQDIKCRSIEDAPPRDTKDVQVASTHDIIDTFQVHMSQSQAQVLKQLQDLHEMSSLSSKALREDISSVRAQVEARGMNMERDLASALQAIDRRIHKMMTEVDFSVVLDEIKTVKTDISLHAKDSPNHKHMIQGAEQNTEASPALFSSFLAEMRHVKDSIDASWRSQSSMQGELSHISESIQNSILHLDALLASVKTQVAGIAPPMNISRAELVDLQNDIHVLAKMDFVGIVKELNENSSKAEVMNAIQKVQMQADSLAALLDEVRKTKGAVDLKSVLEDLGHQPKEEVHVEFNTMDMKGILEAIHALHTDLSAVTKAIQEQKPVLQLHVGM